jgi:hypothetical protein
MRRLRSACLLPIGRTGDRALAGPVFRRDTVHRPVLPQVFQGDTPLVFDSQFGHLAAFLMQSSIFLCGTDAVFSNAAGFTPYSRLKRTALASSAFFPFPFCHYSISWLLNKSNNIFKEHFNVLFIADTIIFFFDFDGILWILI